MGLFAVQGVLILLGVPFWALLLTAGVAALCAAISVYKYQYAAVGKPVVAYGIAALLFAISFASFWFAPDNIAFKLRLGRAVLLDLALIWFACIVAAHARGTAWELR